MNDMRPIDKSSVCEILADIYPTDGEKVVGVERIDKAYEAVLALPPAKPEIIRCRECVRYQTQDCFMYIERLWELTPDDYCSQGERKSG